MLVAVAIAMLTCNSVSGQIVDEVTFNGVAPDPNGIGDTQNYTIANSGSIESLFFFGTITEVNLATFGSEVSFDYNGSGVSGAGNQLTTVAGFTDSLLFQGQIPVTGNIATGDNWSFNFFEGFDDGGDGLVDANVDVTFQYLASEAAEVLTNLGTSTLDDGFYDRSGFGGAEDHPFSTVDFQVTEDGIYSIESNWFDGAGGSFDGFLYVFDQPFDGIDDTGSIAFNDDGTNGLANSTISTVFLEQGITYTALSTTFAGQAGNTGLSGDLVVGSLAGGGAFLVSVPEPGTGLLLVSMAGLAMIQRRRG